MSSLFYPLPKVLPVIGRNPSFIQLGNTGFRNCERLHQLLPLTTSIHGSVVLLQKKRTSWDCEKIADALLKLRSKKNVAAESIEQLPSFTDSENPAYWNYSGIHKGMQAASELGLIYNPSDIHIRELTEERILTERGAHYIKANGWRAQSYLLAQSISCLPYQIDSSSDFILFRLASIFSYLAEKQQKVKLTADELTCFVFSKSWKHSGKSIAQKIIDHRAGNSSENKYSQVYLRLTKELNIKQNTLKTYTHANIMALKTTGLFQSRQSSLRPDSNLTVFWDALSQRKNPFGDAETIKRQRIALEGVLNRKNRIQYDDLAVIEMLSELDGKQAHSLNDPQENVKNAEAILRNEYNCLIFNGKTYEKQDINKPAALEWAMPTLLLNRFKLTSSALAWGGTYDANGCPFQHAPAGRSDSVIETPSLCLGLEATLVQGLQQNQAEHISVTKHAAKLFENSKSIYRFTIFIAPKIDANLYSSFGFNPWFYKDKDSSRDYSPVIPLTCAQFLALMKGNHSVAELTTFLKKIDESRPFHSKSNSLSSWTDFIDESIHDWIKD